VKDGSCLKLIIILGGFGIGKGNAAFGTGN